MYDRNGRKRWALKVINGIKNDETEREREPNGRQGTKERRGMIKSS